MKIKSISDLITNSSSEVFCIISGDKPEVLEQIHSDLYDFFDCWKQEYEQTVYLNSFDSRDDKQIKIDIPYSKNQYLDLYKIIIEEICKNKPVSTKFHYERF